MLGPGIESRMQLRLHLVAESEEQHAEAVKSYLLPSPILDECLCTPVERSSYIIMNRVCLSRIRLERRKTTSSLIQQLAWEPVTLRSEACVGANGCVTIIAY